MRVFPGLMYGVRFIGRKNYKNIIDHMFSRNFLASKATKFLFFKGGHNLHNKVVMFEVMAPFICTWKLNFLELDFPEVP